MRGFLRAREKEVNRCEPLLKQSVIQCLLACGIKDPTQDLKPHIPLLGPGSAAHSTDGLFVTFLLTYLHHFSPLKMVEVA